MCLFTHFAVGALAGGLTGNVWSGALAGIVSHAVLDVFPHYDHPDWRMELAGGLAGLLLLVLLPFASAAAVVGGLCGMLPDLENLLNKLGKLPREKFIFPSHTGLIPHGRKLGPGNLAVQGAIFAGCFVLLGLTCPGEAAASSADQQLRLGVPETTVQESSVLQTRLIVVVPVEQAPLDWGSVDLERVVWALSPSHQGVENEAGPRLPPSLNLSLAVPTRGPVPVHVEVLDWLLPPSGSSAADNSDPVLSDLVLQPSVYRSVPVAALALPLVQGGGIPGRLQVTFVHQPQGSQKSQLERVDREPTWDKADRSLFPTPARLVNPWLFEALSLGSKLAAIESNVADKAEIPDYFLLAYNWVKFPITEAGLYRITGQELLNMGVATGSVDPTKLRLFRGGGLPLDENPEVTEFDQSERVGLNEMGIQVLDGGDGEWNLQDEIRFFGFGSSCWLDRLDASADGMEHFDHPYANEAYYWLTWENFSTASPLPGAPLHIETVAAPAVGGEPVRFGRVRLHEEQQYNETPGLVADNWTWSVTVNLEPASRQFLLRPIKAASSARFVLDWRGIPLQTTSGEYVFRGTGWLNQDLAGAATTEFLNRDHADSLRIRVVGDSQDFQTGLNQISLRNDSDPIKNYIALDSFDIFYWADLTLEPEYGQLEFAHWAGDILTPGETLDFQVTVPSGGQSLFWDVSDPALPRPLSGTVQGGVPLVSLYGVTRAVDTDFRAVACTADMMLSVRGGRRVFPTHLRALDTAVDYLIIHPAEFSQPAGDLAEFRSLNLPGIGNPSARAVDVGDIFDNFSGGQKDPLAIRNFLRWVYESGGHRLRFVCLLGSTTKDYRNYLDRTPLAEKFDLVSSGLHTYFPFNPYSSYSFYPFSSDDVLVSFDDPESGSFDAPDLACGRLPATTLQEANDLVARAIAYADDPAPGLWRNRVLMTADDMYAYTGSVYGFKSTESMHTAEAEDLSNFYLPLSLEIHKAYGVAYPSAPGSNSKPALNAEILARLNEGTTIFYYVGHGSEDLLADEQIFMETDISALNNDLQRPFFMAFSCKVGDFSDTKRSAMAEKFMLSSGGGSIASLAASQVSWPNDNDVLSEELFANMFPEQGFAANLSMAEALSLAKGSIPFYDLYNALRYNFLGEPALVIPYPTNDLAFTPDCLDTLWTGARQIVTASGDSREALLGPGDGYHLQVEESGVYISYKSGEILVDSVLTDVYSDFPQRGAPIFLGNGTLGSGELRIPFMVPVDLQTGELGRVRLLISGPDGDRAVAKTVPVILAAAGPNDDIFGPEITMGFADNRYRVRAGDELVATLQDTSSIAILGTYQANSISLEFDDSGFLTDLTPLFNFDPDSYTKGRLAFPLPTDLAMGAHRAALFAGDGLGNVGSDTLSFLIVPGGVTDIHSVTPFPNPTPGPCRLLFETTDAMDVRWEIFTLAGRRIKTVAERFGSGGTKILNWDGRDNQGDEIANGTYLYVLRGRQVGGKEKEITKTGKLVMMR